MIPAIASGSRTGVKRWRIQPTPQMRVPTDAKNNSREMEVTASHINRVCLAVGG